MGTTTTKTNSDNDVNHNNNDINNNTNTVFLLRRRREQRLKGALRLYELGFRVHAKRAAAAAASSSSSSTTTRAANTATARRVSTSEQQQQHQLQVQQQQQAQHQDDELRSATRYALALINNCAQIHDELGHPQKAILFRSKLLSFLLMMVDGGESMNEIVCDDVALDGYLKNVFSQTIFKTEIAPAAAA